MVYTFGRKHRGWYTVGISFYGDKYHKKKWRIAGGDPSFGVHISNNYIYVCLKKWWIVDWRKKELDALERRKIRTSHFYLIDVYSRKDFTYMGTVYPFDPYVYWKDGEGFLQIWCSSLSSDTSINCYLEMSTSKDSTKFRKLMVNIYIPDSLLN